jgi:hypothetical protein
MGPTPTGEPGAIGATQDRACAPCPAGTYRPADAQPMSLCQPWSVCPAGTAALYPGRTLRDVQCVTCAAPYAYQPAAGALSCLPALPCDAAVEVTVVEGNATTAAVCASRDGRCGDAGSAVRITDGSGDGG